MVLAKELDNEGDGSTSCNESIWKSTLRLRKKTTDGNQQKDLNNQDHSSVKISSNTEKRPGDQWSFAITQTLIKDDQQTPI